MQINFLLGLAIVIGVNSLCPMLINDIHINNKWYWPFYNGLIVFLATGYDLYSVSGIDRPRCCCVFRIKNDY